ncbi:MAG: type II secretion system F family protein [Myxococcota bacterium]|nr:type II secretion system F family protein [Myxococcota bacterium]
MRRLSPTAAASFLDGVGTIVATGGTLEMAFSTFEKSARSRHEQELAALLKQVVLRGEGLAAAGELLDRAVAPGVGLVLISAEQSGRIDTATTRLADLMRTQASNRRAFVFSIGQLVFGLTVASVVPSPFQFVAWIIGASLLVLGGLLVMERRRGWGVSQQVWKLPWVGRLLQGQAVIRIFTVLGLGIEAGRSLSSLLGECAQGEPNQAAAAACEQASRSIDAGSTLYEALSESLVLEQAEVAQLTQAETMGRVPAALHRIVEDRLGALQKRLRKAGFILIILPYILFVVPFVVLIFFFSFQ